MSKIKWENPKLKNLGVEGTNETPTPMDMPHPFICKGCGTHNTFRELVENFGKCKNCCSYKFDRDFSCPPTGGGGDEVGPS